ncbi:MAG: serine/threonine-protein phosphatase [Lachnospiraceae bacterium]|nr:serine/threonine-protein phosphatase [Lachnospiraceae bacterium]
MQKITPEDIQKYNPKDISREIAKELSERRKNRKPLEKDVYITLVTGMMILLLMAGVVLLILYPYIIVRGIKHDTNGDMRYSLSLVDTEYLEDLYARVKEEYYSVSAEESEYQNEDEYIERFEHFTEEEGFQDVRNIIFNSRSIMDFGNVAFCFFDEANERLVFVVDGDSDDNFFYPGQWLSSRNSLLSSISKIKRVKDSDWFMDIRHVRNEGWLLADFVDVTDSDGNSIGVAYTDLDLDTFLGKIGRFTFGYMYLMLGVIVIMIVYISNFLRKRVIRPIDKLSETAVAYTARDKTIYEEADTYFEKLDINTGDEIEDLWRSLVGMEEDMNSTLKRIREMTSIQERLDTELAIANTIQSNMLPGVFPPFPERKDFALFAKMLPAREVGGDFYDFFLVDDDHIALVIADVSDKGIPAALFMMTARTIIKNYALTNRTPSEILTYVNRQLCGENEAGLFVTVWIAIVELSTGKGKAANAGHMHPALCRSKGEYELVEYTHSLPVGIMEDTVFEEHDFELHPGDRVFVYTDGVTEAADTEDNQFGTSGMLKALNKKPDTSPEETLDGVLESIREFAEGADQNDDITMLGFDYFGT